MTAAVTYEVKSPAAILAEDVICQSFIQSSSTLAYACLLIRQGKYDLAAHVLHSLEAKPASRFKDMVFYLQAQIGIETADFATIKKRLVPRVHQHPNDMVALSLLESCVAREYEAWMREHPAEAALAVALAQAQTPAASAVPAPSRPVEPAPVQAAPAPRVAEPWPASAPLVDLSPAPAQAAPEQPFVPAQAVPHEDAFGNLTLAGHLETPIDLKAPPEPEPIRSTVPIRQIRPGVPAQEAAPVEFASEGGDFGAYVPLISDPQAFALTLWNTVTRKLRSSAKREDVKPLVALLPQALPHPLSAAVRTLDGGEINKICFCFASLTVTTLHSGAENLGLVTGSLGQSLLTMVRAENLFQRNSPPPQSVRGTAAGTLGRELEVTSNE